MDDKHQHHQADTGPDHAKRNIACELVFHDQRHGARDHQQEGQPAEAMVTVAVVVVVSMVMAPVAATIVFSKGAVVILWFIQREFIAYADTDLAHLVFLKVTAICGRRKKIIIKSSKVNPTHQKVIISA